MPSGGAHGRLFVACELAPPDGAELVSRGAALAAAYDARPIPADRLHLTLVFLGDTPLTCVPELAAALRHICAGVAPIRAALSMLGGPPGQRTSRVLAATLADDGNRLAHIAGRIAAALAPICRFAPVPDPFWAHVTLARLRRPAAIAPVPAHCEHVFAFRRITLYASRNARSGAATYLPLARIALTADDPPH